MRRRSNLDFEKRRRSRKTGYHRRKAKKKGFGNLPKAKKKIHLNLEMIRFYIYLDFLRSWSPVWWHLLLCGTGDNGQYGRRFHESGA